jgi:transposase InsO family protein
MRTYMKRLNRLTIAFSKKLDNLKAALAIHFWHYNFKRLHRTLGTTPAMAANITNNIVKWGDILSQ